MRAREILEEDYHGSLVSDLTNLLVGAKGSGSSSINTRDLVMQLQNMGYSVDENSIISLLSDNPAVTNVTPQAVTLKGPEGASMGSSDPSQDTAARVKDMAAKASKI